MLKHGLAVGSLLALTWSMSAAAQPTVWEKVRAPESEQAYEILTVAESKLAEDVATPLDLIRRHRTLRELVTLLEGQRAEQLPDARLKYLLADLYSNSLVGRYEVARRVLEAALADAPNSPLAGNGWFLMGVICAKLDDPTCEFDAYTRALDLTFEHELRANILLNRGESSMVLGDLDAAIEDYRQAVRLARGMELVSLAYYGLGIALERSGDLPSALTAMRQARANWPALAPYTALDQPSVFFVPSYDTFYYKALEAMALARRAAERREHGDEQRYLHTAIDHWTSYLLEAESENHDYVPNAKLHRRNCQRDLERSLAKHPPRASSPGEPER